MRSGDEITEHGFRNFEIGDYAIAEGTDSLDVAGCTPQHFLGLTTDCEHSLVTSRVTLHRHNGRFATDDSLSFDVNKRSRRAKVDGKVARE